ncbi:MAG: ATPase [Rhodospirillaceae bacterium]|nr:ATPase [Rhodospirillaceae bacterium]MBT5658588.1 ATPase [Rhodospirillaceae bacterium]MBT5752152.1 ATPase [Rhodospirillaceae bacterium]
MKRFYESADVDPLLNGGYQIVLDDKPIRTPGGNSLTVSGLNLAVAIAEEWSAQDEEIDTASMPLMRLAATAIDRVTGRRYAIIDELVRYAESDLLCYRADEPPDLADRQDSFWQPLLDWVAQRYKAPLLVTVGITPVSQPSVALHNLREAMEEFDDMALSGLHSAASDCGSLVLALALAEGHIEAEHAFEASQLDESFQIERWGEDSEASKRRSGLRADIIADQRFLSLCRQG